MGNPHEEGPSTPGGPDEFAGVVNFAGRYMDAARRIREEERTPGFVDDRRISRVLGMDIRNPRPFETSFPAPTIDSSHGKPVYSETQLQQRITEDEARAKLGMDFLGSRELFSIKGMFHKAESPVRDVMYMREDPILGDILAAQAQGEVALYTPIEFTFGEKGNGKIRASLGNIADLMPELFSSQWFNNHNFAWNDAIGGGRLIYLKKDPISQSMETSLSEDDPHMVAYKSGTQDLGGQTTKVRIPTAFEVVVASLIYWGAQGEELFKGFPVVTSSKNDRNNIIVVIKEENGKIKLTGVPEESLNKSNYAVHPCRTK